MKLTNAQYFIDSSLSTLDKAFTQEILKKCDTLRMVNLPSLKEAKDFSVPMIIFSHSDISEGVIANFSTSPIIIYCLRHNLSFFMKEAENRQSYDIYSLEELSDVLTQVSSIFSFYHLNIASQVAPSLVKPSLDTNSSFSPSVSVFQSDLYKLNQIEIGLAEINQLLIKYYSGKLEVLNLNQVRLTESEKYLQLFSTVEENIYLCFSPEVDSTLVQQIGFVLKEYLGAFSRSTLQLEDQVEIKDELNQLSFPLFVLDSSHNIVISNKAYMNLAVAPTEIIEAEDQVLIKGNTYKIIKRKFEDKLFVACVQLDKSELPVNSELGIIASSIAHELNNPLGGISAALDVLLLDDHDLEIKGQLGSMKETVLRCKKLVKLFLGFSRYNLEDEKLHLDLQECLEQAFQLIRYRLAENNIQLDINTVTKDKNEKLKNPHVMTILFYLLMSEILTETMHTSLISDSKMNKVELSVIESKDRVTLKFSNSVSISDKLYDSRLFKHLLEILTMTTHSDKGIFVLIDNN